MRAGIRVGGVGLGLMGAALSLWWAQAPPPAPSLTSVDRAVAIHSLRPAATPAEVAGLLVADDRARADLGGAVPGALAQRLAAVEVTDAEARAWYDAHREVFGHRSFATSQEVVDQLVRIDAVRAELGGTP